MFQAEYWYMSIVGLNEEKAFVCELGPNLSFKSQPLKFYPKTFSSPYISTVFTLGQLEITESPLA